MRIVDPMPAFGIDSGMRTLVVTQRERIILLRAALILEHGHQLIEAIDPNHQGESEDIGDALCLAPAAIRTLATEGIDVTDLVGATFGGHR